MRFLRQTFIGIFLTAVAVGLLALAANNVRGAIEARNAEEDRKPSQRERVFAVGLVTAVEGREVPVLEAFGEVRATRTLEVRSASSGRIIEMSPAFVEGGAVQEGDALLRIDPTEAEAHREQMRADLADAQAEVRDAEAALMLARDDLAAAENQANLQERALARQQDLATRGVGTAANVEAAEISAASALQSVLAKRQALTQAEARIAQSATRLTRARVALSEAERRVDDTVITAPFDGTLSGVTLTLGRLVANNEQLATLIDPRTLEVSFRLSTAQYARLLDDNGVLDRRPVIAQLDVSGIDLTAQGQIQRDSAAVGEAQSGRLVFATLDRAPGFKPGDFVTVRVEEQPLENVVRLPAAAVDGSGTVLALADENRLDVLEVTLLRRQNNDVLVRGDTLSGREIVTARTPLLGPGIAVRPIRRSDQENPPTGPQLVALTDERRETLIAFVEGNSRMPSDVKERILARLSSGEEVPAQLVQRLENRMGG